MPLHGCDDHNIVISILYTVGYSVHPASCNNAYDIRSISEAVEAIPRVTYLIHR